MQAKSEDGAPRRERTIRWADPSIDAAAIPTLSGIDFLRKIASGELPPPPVAELLGMRVVTIEPSHAVFEFVPEEYMYNPLGSVHGGVVTTLLDTVMGCAVHTTLPAGVGYTTLELKVNFVRPVLLRSGPMRADGKVVHAGTNVATAEARLVDAQGTLFAHATSTLMIFRGRPPP